MDGIHPVVVALGATWALLLLVALGWGLVALRARHRRRRADRALGEPIIDLTFFEEAVQRTEVEGREVADVQRRSLGTHSSV